MLSVLLFATAAHAAPPRWEVLGHAGWVGSGAPAWSGGGVGGAVGIGVAPWASLELSALGGVHGGGGVLLDLRPEARLSPLPWTPDRGGLSLTAGSGLALRDGPRLGSALGAAWDAPARRRVGLRVAARWLVAGDGVRSGLFSVGWVGHPAPPPPPPPQADLPAPVPPPVPETGLPPLRVAPPEARVWIPHPWCDWVTLDELEAIRPGLPPGAELVISAEGHVPVRLPSGQGGEIQLEAAPPQGGLVVVAQPGDRVRTGELVQRVGPDGVLIVNTPQGRVEVEVVGGGRRALIDAVVPAGHAVYRRVSDPVPVELGFGSGRSQLTPAHEATLRALVQDLGAWSLEVAGLASPEGDPQANLALAAERARAVAAAL